jgi:hypothetical protein
MISCTVYFRVVIRPLGILQLAEERSRYDDVTSGQCIAVHSSETATDHLVGRVGAKQNTIPARKMCLLTGILYPWTMQVVIRIASISFLTGWGRWGSVAALVVFAA